MKNIFQNKKVLISIIVAVVVIVVAIVLFVVLGKNGNNKKSEGNSTIKFSEENKTSNKTLGKDNTTNNTSKGSSDVSTGSKVEDYHKKAAEKFVDAFMDEDEMNDFLENYVDVKAYVAYENVEGDETKFWDEYESLADDDPAVEKAKEAFLEVPASYNTMLVFIDSAIKMAEQYADIENQTGNSVENTIDYENFTDEDKKIVLKAIEDPEQSDNDENITKVRITCSWMQEDVELDMVFYGDIVIYICDEEGISITESGSMNESGLDQNPVEPASDEEN